MGLMCLGGRISLVLTLSPDTPESLSLMTLVKLPFTRFFSSLRPMTYKQDRVIRQIALPRIVKVSYVRSEGVFLGPMFVLWTEVSYSHPLRVLT